MKNNKQQPLEFTKEDLTLTQDIHGQRVEVMVSPYDVPEAIRVYQPTPAKRWVIEFKYISNEEERVTFEPGVEAKFVLGKFSGRLYELHISEESPIFKLRESAPALSWAQIDAGLKTFVSKLSLPPQESKYELTRRALLQCRPDLAIA